MVVNGLFSPCGSGANGRELFSHANATLDALLTLMTSNLYRSENKLLCEN